MKSIFLSRINENVSDKMENRYFLSSLMNGVEIEFRYFMSMIAIISLKYSFTIFMLVI